jgi:diguanylate cyclase (GGDEF)-like protein
MQITRGHAEVDSHAAAVRREQLRLLFGAWPLSLATTVVLSSFLLVVNGPAVPRPRMLLWFGLLMLVTACRTALYLAWRRAERGVAFDVRRWDQRHLAAATAAGAAWGAASLLSFPRDVAHEVFLAFIVAGVSAGAVTSLAADRRAAFCFLIPSVVPLTVQLLLHPNPISLSMGLTGLLYVAVIGASVLRTSAYITENIELRIKARSDERERLHLATHDPLTGLPNPVFARERIEELAKRAGASGGRFALLLLELRDFDRIGGSLGQVVADEVVRSVGRIIGSRAGPEDLVARVGAARFLLIVRGHDPALATQLGMQLIRSVQSGLIYDEVTFTLDARVGVCFCPEHGDTAADVLRRLETTLYDAQERNLPLALYESGRDETHRRQLALLGELRRAIAGDGLEVYYQPKVNLQTREVRSLEALARWFHPQLGEIPPGEFVPLAERTGAVTQVTRWVLTRVLRQMRDWRAGGFDPDVSVNLSAPDLLDPELPGLIVNTLGSLGVPPQRLVLEITESAVMREPDRAVRVMEHLLHYGIRFSIDDFGAGYSSLVQLKRLPVDELKIDRTFVSGLRADSDDAFIVRSTVDLGHNLGVKVTAEGVETAECWRQLLALGCDDAQGYLIARPMPAGEVSACVARLNQAFETSESVTQEVRALRELG